MNLYIKELNVSNIETIKTFFKDIFTKEPWNDDWSNEEQLHNYILDLIGQSNSLTLGFFSDDEMVGLSMGHSKHWYTGTEYCIDELCIERTKQGQGIGTKFLNEIEQYIAKKGLTQIFLQTERTVPAYEFYKKNGFYELMDHVSFGKQVR